MNNQIDIIGVLENRNSKLKINHRIGSRDIANQEIKEISACIDNLIPHIREAVEKAKKYDDKGVLQISQEERGILLRYINAHINEINDFLSSAYTTRSTSTQRFWRDERDKLKAIIKKIENSGERK